MSIYHTPEVLAIVTQVEAMLTEVGAIQGRQAFSFWVPAANLLRVHVVCESLHERALNAILPLSAHLGRGSSTSYCREYTFEIVVNLWGRSSPSHERPAP